LLSLAAKLGGAETLGEYALAVAVVTPVVMLAHLNLRAVLATDIERRHPLGDYLAARLAASGLGLAAIGVLALFSSYSGATAAAIVLTGVGQSAETISDAYYGAMQRREEMRGIARSMMARAALSVAAFGAVLYAGGGLVWALAALAAARCAVLLLYDRPAGSAGECLTGAGAPAAWEIVRTALPLGVVLMLVSLNTNLPRYAIERVLGVRELGAFAAVASFVTVGSTLVNALGQAATPRLAGHFSRGERAPFLRLTLKLAGVVLALGAAGVLTASLFGAFLLRILYRPEFAAHAGLLNAVMGVSILAYLAIALGYVLTSVREFKLQVPLFCCAALGCGTASWLLVPRFGLAGAVMALAVAPAVQIAGGAALLARALARVEAAA
jgi:O-antigen/teichoic acid export membrane protein